MEWDGGRGDIGEKYFGESNDVEVRLGERIGKVVEISRPILFERGEVEILSMGRGEEVEEQSIGFLIEISI